MRKHHIILESKETKPATIELVHKTTNLNLLLSLFNYLKSKVVDDDLSTTSNNAKPSKDSTVTETVAKPNVKAQVLDLLSKLDDASPEWEKIIAVLRKDELTQLAQSAVQIKMGSVNQHMDKKLRDMVMRVKLPFELKQTFLSKLARGDGFFDGTTMINKSVGNVYDEVKSNPIASILARQMALEFRGEMGYGPSQGPGEIMMVLLGKNIELAVKGDLRIGNKVAEVKATGRGANRSLSGGRLYSTTGYGSNSMLKRELYARLIANGIPKDVLLRYGFPTKDPSIAVIPGGLNLNPSGLTNLSDLIKEYELGRDKAIELLDTIINGLYTRLPDNMKKAMHGLVDTDGTFDSGKFLIEMTKLAHNYYMLLEGHDVLMLFNSENGNYAIISSDETLERLLKSGAVALTSHLDLNDDRSKGSSQIIMK